MSSKKKGNLTTPGEWKKHLRPDGKREFWGGERAAEREAIREEQINLTEISETTHEVLAAPPPAKPKKPGRFGIESRFVDQKGKASRNGWYAHYRWYSTAKRRDQAIDGLTKAAGRYGSWGRYEYRAVER